MRRPTAPRAGSPLRALAGVEAMAMLAKGQVRAAPADDISAQRIFVHRVFGFVA